jgi:hypothetical protein
LNMSAKSGGGAAAKCFVPGYCCEMQSGTTLRQTTITIAWLKMY